MNNSTLRTEALQIKPIKWDNFLSWMRLTAAEDRKKYKPKNRPMSARRILHMFVPNLKSPIFIIGSPRSGTTFLGSCIAELPEISYHHEPVATKAAAHFIYRNQWESNTSEWFYRTVYTWLMRLHFDVDLRFAEKTPHNSFLLPFLLQTFPDAQCIHLIRDGRDVALSYSKKPWLQAAQADSGKYEPGGYPYGPYPRFWVEPERFEEFRTTSDIHRCIWAWRRFNENALAAAPEMPKQQYYQLRYENLVFSPTEEAERLLSFLSISKTESCRIFQEAVCKVKTNSIGQWKKELSNNQLRQIELEAGELLHKLDYKK